MWVFDENEGMNCRDITYVPGLYKIFDEILGELFFFEVKVKQSAVTSFY